MQHKCLPSRGTVDPSPQMPAEHLLWGQPLIWARGPVGTRPTWAWLQGSQAGGKGRHQIHGREWRVSGHRSQSTSKERQLGGVAPWLGAQKPPWQSKPKQGTSPAVVCGEGVKARPRRQMLGRRGRGGGERRGAGRVSAWQGGQGTVGCSGDDPGSCQGRDPDGV